VGGAHLRNWQPIETVNREEHPTQYNPAWEEHPTQYNLAWEVLQTLRLRGSALRGAIFEGTAALLRACA